MARDTGSYAGGILVPVQTLAVIGRREEWGTWPAQKKEQQYQIRLRRLNRENRLYGLRDATDQQVGTLRVSQADYLIPGDKDLLALAEKYPIVTRAAFWERYG